MNILVVAPGPSFSTFDVYNYYTLAFRELGHKVSQFDYHNHFSYHASAIAYFEDSDEHDKEVQRRAIGFSAEGLISKIARTKPDLVFFISGLAIPYMAWDWVDTFKGSLKESFETMCLFTESPYIEESQIPIIERVDIAATMDLSSLEMFQEHNERSMYVKHAFHPDIHKVMPYSKDHVSDVFMVGTGFPERIKALASVNWGDIDLRVFGGNWMDLPVSGVIEQYCSVGFLDNIKDVPRWYSNSKINLNMYRTAKWPGESVVHIESDIAYSISPRCYEVMACGGFLLTNSRPELHDLFEEGKEFVVFESHEELEDKIKYYLVHSNEREKIAMAGWKAVREHTFANRAREILAFME